MHRFSPILFLGLCFSIAALAAPAQDEKQPPKKAVTADDLKKAIANLGSPRFAVRDQAKKLLSEAGAAAEPLLEEAAKSADEEIANAAKSILEQFQWGLYPDTAKEVRDLIDAFRAGSRSRRQEAIAGLLKRNPAPFPLIRRLISREADEDIRSNMLGSMYQRGRELAPELLVKGELDAAEQMLEEMLPGAPVFILRDYAALMKLRGKLGSAIASLEKQREQKGDVGEQAAEALTYLYCNKGDWAAAQRAAVDSKRDGLVADISWRANDWKSLASDAMGTDGANDLGAMAAYLRVTGDMKGFDEKIAEITKLADDTMDDQELHQCAVALLLNGKSRDAVKILVDRKREMGFTFDLLCAQLKFKEAFALVDEARRGDTDQDERDAIEVRRARLLYQLGEKDAAIQLFGKIAEQIRSNAQGELRSQQLRLAHDLVRAMLQVGLRELASVYAVQFVNSFGKSDNFPRNIAVRFLLEPIFGDDYDAVRAWLTQFEREFPIEPTATAIKRVNDILTGKLDKRKLEEWIAVLLKTQPDNMVDKQRNATRRPPTRTGLSSLDLAASAYRAIADDAKTEEYLKKAAENAPTRDRWLALGDFQMKKEKYKEASEAFARAAITLVARPPRQVLLEELRDQLDNGDRVAHSPALAIYLQGLALLSAGNDLEGKRLVELAHWLPLGDETVRANLANELAKRDWADMAHLEADFLLKTGDSDNVLGFLYKSAFKEKDYFKAAEYYEKWLIGSLRTGALFAESRGYLLAPQIVGTCRARGYLAKGEVEKAQAEALAILEATPGNIEFAIQLIPDLNKLGKKKEALDIYEKVWEPWERLCKDYPNSGYAHNSLAWLIAICGGELDVALKHAQKAVDLEPENAQHLDTLAEVYFRKGDRDKAISLMKKCAELDPKRSYYRKQLARFKDQAIDSLVPDAYE